MTTNSAGSLVLTNQFGDLNNDGQVDVRDVVLLTDHLTGIIPLSPALTNRADLNQNNVLDPADRTVLADLIACRNTKADEDFDGDELTNGGEIQRGTNPFLPDTDGDGWFDGWEVAEGTNPLDAQSGLKAFVIARPPVQVVHPLIQDTDTNVIGTVLARPPVEIFLPVPAAVEETGASRAAQPTVEVVFPLLQNSNPYLYGAFFANPPITITNLAQ